MSHASLREKKGSWGPINKRRTDMIRAGLRNQVNILKPRRPSPLKRDCYGDVVVHTARRMYKYPYDSTTSNIKLG